MLKKITILGLLSFMMLGLAACQSNANDSNLIFYYSLTCPHCQNVEKYVADNNVKDNVTFEEKEVSENNNNAADFAEKIEKCSIKPEEAGVPLLWDGEKEICLLGDEKIIGYFFQKMKESGSYNQ